MPTPSWCPERKTQYLTQQLYFPPEIPSPCLQSWVLQEFFLSSLTKGNSPTVYLLDCEWLVTVLLHHHFALHICSFYFLYENYKLKRILWRKNFGQKNGRERKCWRHNVLQGLPAHTLSLCIFFPLVNNVSQNYLQLSS